MAVSTEESIAVNSLLLEREATFARLHAIESKINKLLGQPYPFNAPSIYLPSAEKRKNKKSRVGKPAKDVSIRLRRLNPDEVAYQITWTDKDQQKTTEVTNIRSIATILSDMLPGTKLKKVETISISGAKQTIYGQ